MEASVQSCFFIFALSIISALVSGMPTINLNDLERQLEQNLGQPSKLPSWTRALRNPRPPASPRNFNDNLFDLNRDPNYYNYHMLPEAEMADLESSLRNVRPRQRRSPLDFGRFGGGVDARFPSDDIITAPRFRDEQPRHPERTPLSDFTRTECIEGGPSCTPQPKRKYFDFYS